MGCLLQKIPKHNQVKVISSFDFEIAIQTSRIATGAGRETRVSDGTGRETCSSNETRTGIQTHIRNETGIETC